MRFFNISGPVDCERNYCLPPLKRFDLEHVEMLIAQQKYFVMYAPKQTGKTTCMLALMHHLNVQGVYRCLYVSLGAAKAAGDNMVHGMQVILRKIADAAENYLSDRFPREIMPELLQSGGHGVALANMLGDWAAYSDKPLVIIFDDMDSMTGNTYNSFLRQLRSRYNERPGHFPPSVILCGVHDIRDYQEEYQGESLTGGAVFNIKDEALRLEDFSREDTIALLQQHAAETGQIFREDASEVIWSATQGQPWLVNALAHEVCCRMREGEGGAKPITRKMVEDARKSLVLRKDTHLQLLITKLQEERVRKVVGPLLEINRPLFSVSRHDMDYVTELGLIRLQPQLEIANPIYRELIRLYF